MTSRNLARAGLALALACAGNAFAATLDIAPDGTLMGAHGVSFAGIAYDVKFLDGVVKNNVSVFHASPIANQASAALLGQVLLGDYDTLAKPTNGCSNASHCSIWTPTDGGGFALANNYSGSGDATGTYSAATYANTHTAIYDNVTLAVWSVAATAPVPEASTWAMWMAGLGLVGCALRRRQ